MLSITSVAFFGFVAAVALFYYLLPRRTQWVTLLVASVAWYCLSADPITFLYLLFSTVVAYAATRLPGLRDTKRGGVVTALAIAANLVVWLAVKGSPFYVSITAKLHALLPFVPVLQPLAIPAALGMGFYTFQVIGYILDCRWGTCEPERNFLKLLLFVAFFPQLTTGPISRHKQLEQLYEPHEFSYDNLTHGAQRILWGMFKKLVIADNVALLVNGAWGAVTPDTGCWAWVAILLYPLQMYCDFSGSMDIVLGVAEVLGIMLPENFETPFFSRTTQEFWQRWHITLGGWARDYVLYPLLKAKRMVKLNRTLRKRFGKRVGKLVTLALSTGALWFVMGVWHGAPKYVVGVGLWYWLIQILGEIFAPQLNALREKFVRDTESFSWHLFQSIRTYLAYAVGATFFRGTTVSQGLNIIKSGVKAVVGIGANPWIFFDDSITKFGLVYEDINIIVIGVILLFTAGVLRRRHGTARLWVDQQGIVLRWGLWLMLLALVLVYGAWGPGYDSSAFIYGQF